MGFGSSGFGFRHTSGHKGTKTSSMVIEGSDLVCPSVEMEREESTGNEFG